MSRTITSSGTIGVTLTNASDAPLRVLANVDIAAAGDYGVLGTGPFAFRVSNLGSLSGATAGVDLQHGGTVASGSGKAPGATISGGRYGVVIGGAAGTVSNFGTITSQFAARTTYPLNGYGYLTTGGVGVQIGAGGSVANGGYFGRQGVIEGGAYGVRAVGGLAVVANTGTIIGRGAYGQYGDYRQSTGFKGIGVLVAQGDVSNGSAGVTSATIIGGDVGVSLGGGGRYGSYVANFGTIVADASLRVITSDGGTSLLARGIGVSITSTGTVSQTAGATIRGAEHGVVIGGVGVVTNYGTISGMGESHADTPRQSVTRYSGVGVYLRSGGTVLNENGTGALIEGGRAGVVVAGGYGRVDNVGGITASGIDRTVSGSTVTTTDVGIGVLLTKGGLVSNGYLYGRGISIVGSAVGVEIRGGRAFLSNYGLIGGEQGVVIGAGVGAATVVNAGTISGTSGTAVRFDSGNDTVILQPGGTFVGDVVASVGGHNTLTLGNLGFQVATLSGLGTQFQNFGTVAEYKAARWDLAGTNTASDLALSLGTGATLDVTGTLAITGTNPMLRLLSGTFGVASAGVVTVGDGPAHALGAININAGTLGGSGTIAAGVIDNNYLVASGSLLIVGSLLGSGEADIAARSILEVASAASVARVNFAGVGSTLVIDQPSSFASAIFGFNQTELIDFARQVVTAVHFDSGSYRLAVLDGATQIASLQLVGNFFGDTFGVMGDGHGGTNLILR